VNSGEGAKGGFEDGSWVILRLAQTCPDWPAVDVLKLIRGTVNEYQLEGCVIITMTMMGVDSSCQFSVDLSALTLLVGRQEGHPVCKKL